MPLDLRNAQAFTPPELPISGLPPVIGAGVNLARLVLYVAAGSIVLLLSYLVFMELLIARDINGAYRQVLNPSRVGSEFYTLSRLEQLKVDLTAARNDASLEWSADSLQNAHTVLEMVATLPSVTSTQKHQLQDCVPLPSDVTRNEKLNRCSVVLDNVRQAALEAATVVTDAQAAGESANKINEHRVAMHTFWIQVAQLILLNLLLPLLTALFGYTFGTQQAQPSQ